MWRQGQGQTSHSALSFTNVMKASGVHAWEDTLPVLLGSKPQTGEVLVSQPWAAESLPRYSLGYGDSQAETRQGPAAWAGADLVRGLTLCCAQLCPSAGGAGSCWYEWHSGAS